MSRNTKLALKIGLPLLILVGAGVVTATLLASREAPEQTETETEAALVEARSVSREEHRLDVRASGTVVPAREVNLQAQVGGEVVEVHPSLVPGGLLEKGERIVQIDRSDYLNAIEQRETQLAQARAQLEQEKGQQQIAEREWELFREEAERLADEGQLEDSALALREPQLASAKAQVDAARAQLETARLNLERTSVEAPFDALVRDENVEIGQLASGQAQMATLVGTEHFWVRLSMATDKIPHIAIPNVNADKGAEATVTYEVGEQLVEREARVLRLMGDLDPAGRMARVIVEIDDPLGLDDLDGDKPDELRGMPLLLDAYVDVEIEGNETRELIEIPRKAVRNGYQVYLIEDGKLAVEPVEIAWRRSETVLVESGIEDGDRVVTGPLPNPVEGMPLEVASDDDSEPGGGSSEETSDPSDKPADEPDTGGGEGQ